MNYNLVSLAFFKHDLKRFLGAAAEGVKAEALYKVDGTLPDPTSTDNPEYQIVLSIIKEGLPKTPQKWTNMAAAMEGVSEETTTGVKRLYEMQASQPPSPFASPLRLHRQNA